MTRRVRAKWGNCEDFESCAVNTRFRLTSRTSIPRSLLLGYVSAIGAYSPTCD